MTIMDELGGKSPFFFGNTYRLVDFLRGFGSESLPAEGSESSSPTSVTDLPQEVWNGFIPSSC